jgi:ribosomal protein S18 acetylase RimI-like enzyme
MRRMRVRVATSADIALLAGFVIAEAREAEGRALAPEIALHAVTAAIHDPALARYWIAEEEARPSGAIAITREWSDWSAAAYWYVLFAFVVPEARGCGVLGALVERVEAAAREAGAPELRLYVHPDNARAVRAYERLGFAPMPYRMMARSVAPTPEAAGELDDDALWTAFHDRTLPQARWTHTAHLRIAWIHLARYALDEAHLRMRAGIVRLNAVHGLVETPARGYHETLTRTWLALVADARRRDPCTGSFAFLARHRFDRDAPMQHYTRERLFSPQARAIFVPPDLMPLPGETSSLT